MKTILVFLSWALGLLLGFSCLNEVPILSFVFVVGGLPFGRFIGGCIEKAREQKREIEYKRQQEAARIKREKEKEIENQNKAIILCRKYPEAAKEFFKQHWGITKNVIASQDITTDKVHILLSHAEDKYAQLEEKLNAAYRTKIAIERLEIIKKGQEQQKKQEEVKRIEERRRQNAIQSLPNCVSSWHTLCGELQYNYLLRYFPTTCDFEANEKEWADRWLVWNFKNTPGKISPINHERALNDIILKLKLLLQNTFGDRLTLLTFVCIPAATKETNNARFMDFSKRLSKETGILNGFEYIQIKKDATPKHLRGSGTPTLQIDTNFFKGKYIILFDDVITSGNSMLRFKHLLESKGAHIIAGISIGKTTHCR
ncbi:phosphoribosyltransferase [Porphyromonas gingivalis]|uniref:phosphoribosyltransferase n=1 Tax=Porphyromonas gingivalis TaxID=837 RepID=UPI001F3AC83F|nr:phosphoribosyltransferase [Porphyromonas gingivalis]MCE8191022.1 phosphoribosyltransferase [Porphyromonas gingivalis]